MGAARAEVAARQARRKGDRCCIRGGKRGVRDLRSGGKELFRKSEGRAECKICVCNI